MALVNGTGWEAGGRWPLWADPSVLPNTTVMIDGDAGGSVDGNGRFAALIGRTTVYGDMQSTVPGTSDDVLTMHMSLKATNVGNLATYAFWREDVFGHGSPKAWALAVTGTSATQFRFDLYTYNGSAFTFVASSSTTTFTEDTWYWVALVMDFGAATPTAQLYVDDTSMMSAQAVSGMNIGDGGWKPITDQLTPFFTMSGHFGWDNAFMTDSVDDGTVFVGRVDADDRHVVWYPPSADVTGQQDFDLVPSNNGKQYVNLSDERRGAMEIEVPASDIARVGWVTHTGATTSLFAQIDDPDPNLPSGADYITASALNDIVTFHLGNPTLTPATGQAGIGFRVLYVGGTGELTAYLVEGATNNSDGTVHGTLVVDYTEMLTAYRSFAFYVDASLISDYSDLQVRFEITSGNPTLRISSTYLSVTEDVGVILDAIASATENEDAQCAFPDVAGGTVHAVQAVCKLDYLGSDTDLDFIACTDDTLTAVSPQWEAGATASVLEGYVRVYALMLVTPDGGDAWDSTLFNALKLGVRQARSGDIVPVQALGLEVFGAALTRPAAIEVNDNANVDACGAAPAPTFKPIVMMIS